MSDQAALQEAIQRARQLAAKMWQNAPSNQNAAAKRPASEMDDHSSIGTVKVTLAYEKPPNSDTSKIDQQRSSSHRDNDYNKDSSSIHSNRDRERDRSRDRDSAYSGSNGNHGAPHSRSNSSNPPSTGYGGSMLSGNNYASGLGGGFGGGERSGGSSADEKIEIIIPHAVIGLVIGKGGENIKRIQNETRATVRVDPNTVDDKGNKVCTITGTKQAVEEAHSQVANVIENAATNKRPRTQVEGSDQYKMKIPASRTGAIIGKGGDTIKSIKQQSGCDIELDKNSKECNPDESVFIIRGTQDKILKARAMIEARLASRGRDGDSHTRSNPIPKGVATGANAAPVAQYTDLPGYPSGGKCEQSEYSCRSRIICSYGNLSNFLFLQPFLVPSF